MRRLFLVLFASLLISTGTVHAVGPTAHGKAATNMLNYWTVTPFLSQYGLSASTIASMAYEADNSPWHDTYEHPCWEEVNSSRGFIFDSKWGNLDETRRLSILCHLAADAGVPLGHSPANQVWSNGTVEALLEARMDTWGGFPGINAYTGTYTDQANTFYSQCIANAQWFQANHSIWNSDYTTAGWAGLTYGQQLGSAMLVNYFLAKAPSVANANGSYAVNPGGNVTFNSSGSYDPDSVNTNSDGSYYNNGGGITSYAWDLNNDGVYETSGASPTLNYDELYSLVGPTEGKTIRLRVQDDEGSTYLTASHGGVGTATATVAVYTPPTAAANGSYAVFEGGAVQLAGSGGDADGGWVSYAWDSDNNGSYETGGQNPTFGYGAWTPSETGHTVRLLVTDNEGQTATDTAVVRVYSNPTANGHANWGWIRGLEGSTDMDYLYSGAADADGGSVTTQWDLNNDGTWDVTGDGAYVVGNDFYNAGLHQPNENHTVTMRGVDNEGQVVIQTSIPVAILVDPVVSLASSAELAPGQSLNLSGSGYDPDGGSITEWSWDLNGDGIFGDFIGQALTFSYADLMALGLHFGENVLHLQITDNDADFTGSWAGTAIAEMMLLLDTPTAGDADYSGAVDEIDYNIWAENYGLNSGWANGDFNLDGVVNELDYNIWAENYGAGTSGLLSMPIGTPVPEPSGIAMLMAMSVLGAVCVLRRQRQRCITAACLG